MARGATVILRERSERGIYYGSPEADPATRLIE